MPEDAQDTRPPRGALIVVAIGLLACVAAIVLTTDKTSGRSTDLNWVEGTPLPDSKAVRVPGDKARMRITDARLRATATNSSGYSLYRTTAVLAIDAGAPVGSSRIRCEMRVPADTEVGQTSGSRASYPRSSDDLIEQPVPEIVVVQFSSEGNNLGAVTFPDSFPTFTDRRGVKIEWPEYEEGVERWAWFLPPGAPPKALRLGFGSVWKTSAIPAVEIGCEVTTSAGTSRVETGGGLDRRTAPLIE